MAFLDEIDKKLTRLGQGALQKTREVSDTAKISATIRNLDSQKKECLEKLGTLFCTKYEMFAGEEERILIHKIKMINSEIKQYQDEVNRIKGVVNCPNCHAEVPVNSKFCSSCGTNMETKALKDATTEKKTICSKCGRVANANQMFCMNCGNNLGSQLENENFDRMFQREKTESAYRNEIATGTKNETTEDSSFDKFNETHSMKCSNCGEELEEGMAFCVYCGTAL